MANFFNMYKFYVVSDTAKFLYLGLKQFATNKGLIKYDDVFCIYNPYSSIEKKQKVNKALRELYDVQLIDFGINGKRTSKYIRVIPWFGEYPERISHFKGTNKKLPVEFRTNETKTSSGFGRWKVPEEKTTRKISSDQYKEIFEFWKEKTNHKRARLTTKRKTMIKKGLQEHTVKELKKAIIGLEYSSWHMGDNPNGVVYNKITHVVKNIDTFIQLAEKNGY